MVQHDSIFTYSCTMCLAEVPVSKQRLKNQPEVYWGLPIFNSLEKRLEMKHAQPVIFFHEPASESGPCICFFVRLNK